MPLHKIHAVDQRRHTQQFSLPIFFIKADAQSTNHDPK